MKIKFLFLFFFISYSLWAQTVIKGIVKDVQNNTLTGASVVVTTTNNKNITYAITDFDGHFLLKFQNQLDSIDISVSYLGYYTQKKRLKNISQNLKFILKPSQERLKPLR